MSAPGGDGRNRVPVGEDGEPAGMSTTAHDHLVSAPSSTVRLLLLAQVRDGIDAATVAVVLGCGPGEVAGLLGSARRSGLLGAGDRLRPAVVHALAEVAGPTMVDDVRRAVLEVELEHGTLQPALAHRLATQGLRDHRLAAVLVTAADAVTTSSPARATELYTAAVWAGAPDGALAVRRGDAAVRAGDLAGALEIVDAAWEHVPDDELGALVQIGATVSVLRGTPRHAAALYRHLGPERAGAHAPLAAVVLWGSGDAAAAAAMAAAPPTGPPTARAAGLRLLVEGLALSLGPDPAGSLTVLGRAVTMLHPPDPAPTPVSATAVAAIAALHAGDLDRAGLVLARSVGDPAVTGPPRAHHLALLGWTAMLRGDLAGADELRAQGVAVGSPALRDELFLRALEVGLARRSRDLAALKAAWGRAGEVLGELTPDLFTLLPLGELWVAAARVGSAARLAPLVEEAQELLARLGDPVLWSSALHWSGVHAAILQEDPDGLRPHAAALTAASHHSEYAAALAMAGQAWLRVLVGRVDTDEVTAAARALARFGLSWDGSRLAGQAALRATGGSVATDLLDVARSLAPSTTTSGSTASAALPGDGTLLSDREREVAALVVHGLTYRDIGEQLFISAKTVEHHVARIRGRLGAQSRSELFAMLRAAGQTNPGVTPTGDGPAT
ncbi:helix-turn-helix transcriptional regulator [Rhodococcus antarcticus]|uniref:Helix-turn-helix transcriptional regulator n=1 Tax=Rhodococcus antarcticus TaxID=2987751 RepID=A0ABY6P0E9_9NOCA|nr:LuxR C-terminal-related transcriptional regulator [Rhodococcus antarcticus]UZJ25008.1 helix-turn-helix transcriptional regulator [Rhodococcus antarcticus]